MQNKSQHSEHLGHHWFVSALLSSVTGLLFSVILSVALVLCSLSKVPFIKSIERAGNDIGATALAYYRLEHVRTPASSPFYIFIDVDDETCLAFAADQKSCRLNSPIPPELAIAFVDAARKVDAAVAIIDKDAYESASDREHLIQELAVEDQKGISGTWVIAPVFSRYKQDSGAFWGDSSMDLIANGKKNNLRMTTISAMNDPEYYDTKVRRVPRLSEVMEISSDAKPIRILPTAAYLASLRISAQTIDENFVVTVDREALEAIDSRYYCNPCDEGQKKAIVDLMDLERGKSIPIRYSMPSASLNNISFSESYNSNYLRIPAKEIISSSFPFFFDLEQQPFYRGAIMVLGSSLVSAGDRHLTPIGPMVGSEILLNEIRTMLEDDTTVIAENDNKVSENIFVTKMQAKIPAILIGFSTMFVAWLGIFWILSLLKSHSSLVRKASIHVVVLLIFVGGIVSAIFIELFFLTSSWKEPTSSTAINDVLTPIVALGLEGYAEAAKKIITSIEHGIVGAAAAISVFTKNVRYRLSRKR